MTNRIRTTLAICAVAATYSIGANAQSISYSQTAGWYSGATLPNGSQQATLLTPFPPGGGLDFFTAVSAPPGAANTWRKVGWGCPDLSTASLCANGGVVGFATPSASDPFTTAGRSALEAFGSSGMLDLTTPLPFPDNWKVITTINHRNQPIGGNVLNSIQVQAFLRLNGFCVDNSDPTCSAPSLTNVKFVETDNDNSCTDSPDPGNAPKNPLGSNCDDFALVSGLDLASIVLPVGSPWNPAGPQALVIDFRINATALSGAIVCDGSTNQPSKCGSYNGIIGGHFTIVIYTAELSTNTFSIQARIRPFNVGPPVPQFVIGNCHWDQSRPHSSEPPGETNVRAVGETVNFWGSQWWKNNCMSEFVSNGYPAFKGFATSAVVNLNPQAPNCGEWQARPGNSGHPLDTLPTVIDIIVTDTVNKSGPNIGDNILQIVRVDRSKAPQDNYAGNPGHQGWGVITNIICGPGS